MAEKINIEDLMVESYSDKTLKSYSGMIADPKSVFGLGSAAATSSMCAASMALRALRMTASEDAICCTQSRTWKSCAFISCT